MGKFNKTLLHEEIPNFHAGDTVKVYARVIEGNRSCIQIFQGIVITRRGVGVGETFMVHKLFFGTGVECILPLHVPTADRTKVVSQGDTRRTKLYYLHSRRGKAAKVTERYDNKTTV